MPPDYELRSYWDARFEKEAHFEWLGDGSNTLLPSVRAHLADPGVSARCSPDQPARLLHIGAGTSSLSERIRALYHDVYGAQMDEGTIVNTDFAENLVAREREKEARRAAGGMQWVCADLLDWRGLQGALQQDEEGGREEHTFELVVDKSTSDAISCGAQIVFGYRDPNIHPSVSAVLEARGEKADLSMSPVELLAVHLASLVRPGGLWVALTFAPHRFSFLSEFDERAGKQRSHAATYWFIEKVGAVDAPTGMMRNVHAPLVQHYIFHIRRI